MDIFINIVISLCIAVLIVSLLMVLIKGLHFIGKALVKEPCKVSFNTELWIIALCAFSIASHFIG